jgi:menaquinone-specific isochorismate synthase
MLTITIAWDNALSWSWENAISALQETLCKVSVNTYRYTPSGLIYKKIFKKTHFLRK